SRPSTTMATGAGPTSDSPAIASPAPTTSTEARGSRRRDSTATPCSPSAAVLAGATARIAGSVKEAATVISGSSPRNTSRQPNRPATTGARIGAVTPGSTQAVDSV